MTSWVGSSLWQVSYCSVIDCDSMPVYSIFFSSCFSCPAWYMEKEKEDKPYEGTEGEDPDPAVIIAFSSDAEIHNILGLATSPIPQGRC